MNYQPPVPGTPGGRTVACPHCNTISHLGGVQPGQVPVCSNKKCGAYLPWVVDASDMTLMDELKCPVTTLLDFWGPWCQPCMRMKPMVEGLAAQWPGRLKVVMVNVDEARGMAATYDVMAVPVIFIGRQGQTIARIDGELPYDQLIAQVTPYV